MADKKMINSNKAALLQDWLNSPTNRQDKLYYSLAEISDVELRQQAFSRGLLISLNKVDDYFGVVTFIAVLT